MSTPLERALTAIDAAHALDPNKVTINNEEMPYELHYAQKCTSYLEKRAPDASEPLRIAIRAQEERLLHRRIPRFYQWLDSPRERDDPELADGHGTTQP